MGAPSEGLAESPSLRAANRLDSQTRRSCPSASAQPAPMQSISQDALLPKLLAIGIHPKLTHASGSHDLMMPVNIAQLL